VKPKSNKYGIQLNLVRQSFRKILNQKHELFVLADLIEWDRFEVALADAYSDKGRPGAPIRLLVGLLYLKYTFNVSDEDLEPRWVENPYWQYFCGYEFMQHEFPIDYTTLIKWRKRIGVERLRELLKETIDLAVRENSLKEKDLSSVNVDTTVQEKNISFPTDSKLACGLIQKLGVEARSAGVKLRQSYRRLSKKKVVEVARYAHAKQFKRMRKSLSKLETWLKRLIRDIERKASANLPVSLDQLLSLSRRYLAKGKLGQDKLYSICEPSVKCISKGKAHKRYEFGQKISIATTNKNNWVVSVDYLANNPFDGHSLVDVIQSIEETAQTKVKEVFVDLGYRGNGYKGEANIHIAGRSNSKLSPS